VIVQASGDNGAMASEVRDNPARSRYELFVDDHLVGFADYRLRGDVVVIPHTEIERSRRGHGLGAALVRGVLDDVQHTGRTIVAECWFVAEFIDDNPEYQALLKTA